MKELNHHQVQLVSGAGHNLLITELLEIEGFPKGFVENYINAHNADLVGVTLDSLADDMIDTFFVEQFQQGYNNFDFYMSIVNVSLISH